MSRAVDKARGLRARAGAVLTDAGFAAGWGVVKLLPEALAWLPTAVLCAPLATAAGPAARESLPLASESAWLELLWKYLMPPPLAMPPRVPSRVVTRPSSAPTC